MEQLKIQPGNPGDSDARRLIEELDGYLNSLYPAESNHLLSVDALQQPNVTFLIARINGKPVGCGAFVNHGKYAEIKRMFVSPDLRGMGIGRRIMDELETRARLDGLTISRLETGVSQPAALELYKHCGYLRRGPFPPYANDPQSVFMEKKLMPGMKETVMERTYVDENKRERERLRKLVNGLTDEELNLILYKEGWTIAVALAHLAFWDQRRLVLVRKWKKQGVSPSPIDEDVINDATLPFFLELPPRKAANMAISIAEEIDRELENLSPDLVNAVTNLGDHHALNRSIHRKMHLDDITNLLKISRGKK